MKRNSKALCMLLAGAMAVSNCPVPVQAAEVEGTQEVVSESVAEAMEETGETKEDTVEAMEKKEESEETEIIREAVQEETVETMEEVVQEETVNATSLTNGDSSILNR